MIDVLYQWPQSAAFGRVIPKNKFYEHGNVSTAVKERVVRQVQRITWAYKLAESTVRIPASGRVPEIQVFAVETKGGDVTDDVLTAIDSSVHFPIIFEVTSNGWVRTVAAHKSLHGKRPTLSAYFTTNWQSADTPRLPLPTALDLPGLYDAILASLLPVKTRDGETVSQATDRLDQSRKLQREVATLEKKMRTEPQLNRKIELRRQIEERSAVLAALTDPVPSNKE